MVRWWVQFCATKSIIVQNAIYEAVFVAVIDIVVYVIESAVIRELSSHFSFFFEVTVIQIRK